MSTQWLDSFFFFQAEDGIRDDLVTGVQTCALPIWPAQVTEALPPRTAQVRILAETPATWAPPQQTGLALVPARAAATRTQTETATAETILAIGSFRVATHRGTQAPSEEHRAKPTPRPAVLEVHPAWEPRGAEERHGRRAQPSARN